MEELDQRGVDTRRLFDGYGMSGIRNDHEA
jgi:hypothetical protein